MINRVTDAIKYNMITNSLFNVQGQYGRLMEKLSTQKNINRPSDDPIRTNDILDYRTALASIEQYQSNITDATSWLKLTETNISGLRNIVNEALGIAISESGASGSAETQQTSLATLNSLIDEALSMLNAQSGDNYIFAGSATDVKPFSATYQSASIGAAQAATTNTFNGTVASSGTYTGTQNMSYVVKITGGTLSAANYALSSDGGATWTSSGTVNLSAAATINVGDGISLGFTGGSQVAVGDIFTVSGNAAGYYQGNDDKLNAVIGKNNNLAYNITGTEAFTGISASAQVTGNTTLKGSVANTSGAAPITGATVWNTIDGANVQNGTVVNISGYRPDGTAVSSSYTIANAATETVSGLLNQIQTAFGAQATVSVDAAGRITLTDNTAGASRMQLNLDVTNPSGSALNFGAVSSTLNDTIVLTRGATAGNWTITSHSSATNPQILGTPTAETLTIDADNNGTADITVKLTGTWSQNDTISLSLTGGAATSGEVSTSFTGSGSIDLLSTLNNLKKALQVADHDQAQELIYAQIDNLEKVGTQMLQYETQAGAKMQSMEVTSSNHNSMDLQITNMLADIENADLTKLITQFQMKQIAMEASYNMASQIGKMTIMDYI